MRLTERTNSQTGYFRSRTTGGSILRRTRA